MFRESLAVLTTDRLNEELQPTDVIDAAVYAPKVRQSLVAKLAEDAETARRKRHSTRPLPDEEHHAGCALPGVEAAQAQGESTHPPSH